MRITLAIMVLLFTEIMLETGLRIDSTLGAGVSVKNVLIYSLFLLAIHRWYNERAVYRDIKVNRLILFYGAFVSYCIISLAIPLLFSIPNYDFQQGVLTLKGGLIDPFLCFIIFWTFTKRYLTNPGKMLQILLIIVTGFCFLMVVERIVPSVQIFGVDNSSDLRLNGPFGEPNQTAAVLSFCLPLAISMIFTASKARIFYIASTLCMVMCIVITGSRGGILGAAGGCLYLLWVIRRQLALSNKILMVVTIPILAVLAWVILPESSRELLLLRFSFVNESEIDWEGASAGRTYLWQVGLKLWVESPVVGQGWSSYQMITGNASHSIYLDNLVSLGIIGLALSLTFYWKLLRFFQISTSRHLNRNAGLIITGTNAGVIALLISLAFVNLYTPWITVWCILGAAAGYSSAYKSLARIHAIKSQA